MGFSIKMKKIGGSNKKLYFNSLEILVFYPLVEKFVINSLFKWSLVLV